jgi:hypothetical protein
MLSHIISNMTNQVLCLVIGRVRLVFGCPEFIPHMEEAQGVDTGRQTAQLKINASLLEFGITRYKVSSDYQTEHMTPADSHVFLLSYQ